MIKMSSVVEPVPPNGSAQDRLIANILFGIVVPTLCFVFDPIVFTGGFDERGFLESVAVLSFVLAASQMVVLAAWLIAGPSLERWAAPVAGFLFVGAAGSIALGIVLLPLSLVGLAAAGIGLLGMTPFLTGWVFFRCAMSAARCAWAHPPRLPLALGLIGGLAVGATIPLEANRFVKETIQTSISNLASDDFDAWARGIQTLRVFRPLVHFDQIVRKYERESDPRRRDSLKVAYYFLTRDNIDRRMEVIRD